MRGLDDNVFMIFLECLLLGCVWNEVIVVVGVIFGKGRGRGRGRGWGWAWAWGEPDFFFFLWDRFCVIVY